jgi:hypothetical protein
MRTIQELHNIDIVSWTNEELKEAMDSIPNESDNNYFSVEEVSIARQMWNERQAAGDK